MPKSQILLNQRLNFLNVNKLAQKFKNMFQKKSKVLFILRKRQKEWSYSNGSSGLFNSANFVCEMLKDNGVDAKVIEVIDGNAIDKEIYQFKPDTVIFEAFWVPPSKANELKGLYPKVNFIVRNHSKPEFLAHEGIAFDYSIEYFKFGIKIACNSHEMVEGYKVLLKDMNLDPSLVFYLPNYYVNEA